MRQPGYPEKTGVTESGTIGFMVKYDCGTILKFLLEGNSFKIHAWERVCKEPVKPKNTWRVDE